MNKIPTIDIASNRRAIKWTAHEKMKRVVWGAVYLFFRFSPRFFWGWRRFLLRAFGAQIGRDVHIYPSVRIIIPWNLRLGDYSAVGDRVILYALGPVTIGERATISQGAHLCGGTHDWRDSTMPLIKSSISIGDECWIAADAFIGPAVTIGKGTIVGARTVVMRDLGESVIAQGNPAQIKPKRLSKDELQPIG